MDSALLPGKIASLLILATLLALAASWLVAGRYRAAMRRLMQAPLTAPPASFAAPEAPPPRPPPAALTLADNRQAYRQLLLGFCALSLLMALSRTLITQLIADGPITVKTVSTLAAAYAWPVVPVLAVIGRWRRRRLVGALALWFVAGVALLSWRTTAAVSVGQVFLWMLFDIGLPLLVVTSLCLGGASRAIGPWLAPLFVLLCWSSQLGIDLLAAAVNRDSAFALAFVGFFGGIGAIVAAALLPWLAAWWPVRGIGRRLAQAYARRRISELFYLYSAVWTVALVGPALGAIRDLGWGAGVVFTPLLWIPLAAPLFHRLTRTPPGRPPTLLVLRVFRQDANVQALFDRVIERWRLTGNTVLIAGTDLVDRTIDIEDIFTFIDGRLGERFIRSPGDLTARLDAFEFRPDLEGRYRVNECYCHDSTWQPALAALVARSDVVVMDLRNFQGRNAGCLHELGVLATARGLSRVTVLVNEHSDLSAALAATAGAPAERFVWLRQEGDQPLAIERILAALFDREAPIDNADHN